MKNPTATKNSRIHQFDLSNFIVGTNNRSAYAAAKTVCEEPGTTYNPLFIYGQSGLGKTHLLKAIAHKIRSISP